MPRGFHYKKPTDEERAKGREMLKRTARVLYDNGKSYIKNVKGGAKIVGKAIKKKLK